MSAIVVFSHLRWDFVFQRPQHLMSRLAAHCRVLFVEEPVLDEAEAHWETYDPLPNLTVCRPHTTVPMPGFHDDQLPQLQKLMRELAVDCESPIAWLYTPMALPLLQELEPALVVYDCMDELSAFRNAPKQLIQRENALLKLANLVFTGGPSLYRAKRDRHANVHCFSSSVDVAHFSKALDPDTAHPLMADIPGPRLGFYGVIDERFDTGLLEQVADARPDWQLIMVGPVVKIDPADLPRRANIHYFGQQPYEALPQFLAGWDVCLLPFAMNESTRFISPTKTLEYMAAEKPIVSTPVADVADIYNHVVYIANGPEAFIASCDAALNQTEAQRERSIAAMREVVGNTSWDATVEQMVALLREAEDTELEPAAAALLPPSAPLPEIAAAEVGLLRAATALRP